MSPQNSIKKSDLHVTADPAIGLQYPSFLLFSPQTILHRSALELERLGIRASFIILPSSIIISVSALTICSIFPHIRGKYWSGRDPFITLTLQTSTQKPPCGHYGNVGRGRHDLVNRIQSRHVFQPSHLYVGFPAMMLSFPSAMISQRGVILLEYPMFHK